MGRRVFFSFHYADSWRVNQVRNSWLGQGAYTDTFVDAVEWQSVERKGDRAVKAWIDKKLKGTSVTVVLIGQRTASRPYVMYEIEQSYLRGNGLVGIYIHGVKDNQKKEGRKGPDPLAKVEGNFKGWWEMIFGGVSAQSLDSFYKTYYWNDDNGRKNLSSWVEEAAKLAGR